MTEEQRLARFGEVEAVFRPSNGQTVAGVLVAVAFAALGVVAAVGNFLDAANRVAAVIFTVMCVALAVWLFGLRKWRLVLFRDGLIQVRAGGVDEIGWEEVREVLHTRDKALGGRTQSVTVVRRGAAPPVVVSPVNLRSRGKMFRALVAAAAARNVPVREVWESAD